VTNDWTRRCAPLGIPGDQPPSPLPQGAFDAAQYSFFGEPAPAARGLLDGALEVSRGGASAPHGAPRLSPLGSSALQQAALQPLPPSARPPVQDGDAPEEEDILLEEDDGLMMMDEELEQRHVEEEAGRNDLSLLSVFASKASISTPSASRALADSGALAGEVRNGPAASPCCLPQGRCPGQPRGARMRPSSPILGASRRLQTRPDASHLPLCPPSLPLQVMQDMAGSLPSGTPVMRPHSLSSSQFGTPLQQPAFGRSPVLQVPQPPEQPSHATPGFGFMSPLAGGAPLKSGVLGRTGQQLGPCPPGAPDRACAPKSTAG
jgi:hypothetical protein